MFHYLIGSAIGFVIGAFTPKIGRVIKTYFVKETTAAKPAIVAGVGKIEKKL